MVLQKLNKVVISRTHTQDKKDEEIWTNSLKISSNEDISRNDFQTLHTGSFLTSRSLSIFKCRFNGEIWNTSKWNVTAMMPCPSWRHQMETFSALLAICAGNSPVPGEFPAQRPVTRSFDVFFDLRPNKRLSKQSRGWWFETLSHSLWCHCNANCKAIEKLTSTSSLTHQA